METTHSSDACAQYLASLSRYGGLLASVTFATAIVVVGSLRPSYSHVTQLVSELGESGGAYSALFNCAGFLPTGLLLLTFAFPLRAWLRERGMGGSVAVLVGIHALGMAAAAWVSCDVTCHPTSPTTMQVGHDVIAAIKFPALIAATFVLGHQLRASEGFAWLARLSIGCGIASLVLMVAFVTTVETRMATGTFQRAFLTVLYAWLCIVSLVVGRSQPEDP